MTAVALGAFGVGLVVGLVVGLTVGGSARRHLRRVNAMLAADAVTARRQRDQWATVAQQPPGHRDWVRRSEVIGLAHIAERAADRRRLSGGDAEFGRSTP